MRRVSIHAPVWGATCELRPYIQVPHTKDEKLANYEIDGRPLLDLLTPEVQSDLALYLHECHERQGFDE